MSVKCIVSVPYVFTSFSNRSVIHEGITLDENHQAYDQIAPMLFAWLMLDEDDITIFEFTNPYLSKHTEIGGKCA